MIPVKILDCYILLPSIIAGFLSACHNYENLLSIIANFYNITINDLISNQRKQTFVLPRHITMYILKNHYSLPFAKIGKILGGRDHTTIMNGCLKIEQELKNNKDLKLAIDTILKKCG